MDDVDILSALVDLLKAGGPFAAFVIIIFVLEPRFRKLILKREGTIGVITIVSVYSIYSIVALIMLGLSIYYWFIQEGVLANENILAHGRISGMPLSQNVISENEEIYFRQIRQFDNYSYEWIIFAEEGEFSENITFIIGPDGDMPGDSVHYTLLWDRVNRQNENMLIYNGAEQHLCIEVPSEQNQSACPRLVQRTLTASALEMIQSEGLIERYSWNSLLDDLIWSTATAEELTLPDPAELIDVLRSPDPLIRRQGRSFLVQAGSDDALPVVERLLELDPRSYRVNLAALVALNEWQDVSYEDLPQQMQDQVTLWLSWPDITMQRRAVEFVTRELEPSAVDGLVRSLNIDPLQIYSKSAFSVSLSVIYSTVARSTFRDLREANPNDTPTNSQEFFESVSTINQLYADSFRALPEIAEIQDVDNSDLVESVQTELNLLGYDIGWADGIVGPLTERAVQQFNTAAGLDGNLVNSALYEALRAEQKAAVLVEWERALDIVSAYQLSTTQDLLVERWSSNVDEYRIQLVDSVPAEYLSYFTSRFGSDSVISEDVDVDQAYNQGLDYILERRWQDALLQMQLVDELSPELYNAFEISRLINDNLNLLLEDEESATYVISQIGQCYNEGMQDSIGERFAARIEEGHFSGGDCPD